jgi:GTP-binding protein
MFVDRVTIVVTGGHGGNGCVSFRREKYVPFGGPDGGDGGNGGSVVIIADPKADSLAPLAHRRHWKAASGRAGSGSNRHGRSAPDLVIHVPPGTIIKDAVLGHVIKDLAQANDQVVAARGGKGGRGNAHFKTATNRAPRESTPGTPGEEREFSLELKLIADVGLIGKPNAGKSTLLSRVSRARPAIADYPFTTKRPNLGIVVLSHDQSFVMADIPGLIEGAHAGVGLGLDFLRHVERTKVLVHLVEPSPLDGSDPISNYTSVRAELRLYDERLAERPEIVVVTKCELPSADEVRERLARDIGREVLSVSAVTGQGLSALLGQITSDLRTA